jgi:hypothetical protein
MRRSQAVEQFQLEAERSWSARQHVPGVPSGLQTRALPGEQTALRGSGPGTEAAACAPAHHVSRRVLPVPSLRRLRRDRRGGPRVRPPPRQVLRRRPGAPVSKLAEHPRRDRKVRGGLRQLPQAADRSAKGIAPSDPHAITGTCGSGRRESNPSPRPWKGLVQPLHHARGHVQSSAGRLHMGLVPVGCTWDEPRCSRGGEEFLRLMLS